ncbi:MAG: hypothetical protein C0483_14375 [Pirellula sp.]|nr:hypothetical protein [Pirellula sp.]
MAVVLVLGMIAMTLAVSYALLRAQAETLRSSSNVELRSEARQAAWTGLSAALRRMNQSSNWAGADSTLTGTINTYQSYTALYTTGDAAATADGPDAADWPYRVTITSTGYAVDPNASTTTTTYKIEAVVKLVPRRLQDNPSPWASMQNYVVYQTNTDDVNLQLPFRIEGPVRLQGSLSTFSQTYPSPTGARNRYLSDLNAMRTNGYPDARPFNGPITLPTNSTSSSIRSLFTSNLGVTLINASGAATSGWSAPGTLSTYQLYPGGKTYTVPSLPSSISATTYQADPRLNPAGLFRAGDVTLGNNAVVVGTIISTGKVQISGTGVSIQPVAMRNVDGASAIVQMPAIVASNDVQINSGASASVSGTVVTFSTLSAPTGTQATQFDLNGRLICRTMNLANRSEFNVGSSWWSLIWSFFGDQEFDSNGTRYFPAYCNAWSMQYTPRITIAPATGPATIQQWFTPGTPVYNVLNGDTGLRWSVLRFKELP